MMTRQVKKAGRFAGEYMATAAVGSVAVDEAASVVLGKAARFFKGFAKRGPLDQTIKQIGKFTEFSVKVPGRVPGSYTRWVKVVNAEGKTIRLYHDTYDATGKFIHRGVKIPGPERHVP